MTNETAHPNLCPNCGAENKQGITKCAFCNESMDTDPEDAAEDLDEYREVIYADYRYSNVLPIWKLVLLYVITLGLYHLVWFYRNWKHLKIHYRLDISPIGRVFGLAVPILSWVLMYDQFNDIKFYAKKEGFQVSYSPGLLLLGSIGILIVSYFYPLAFLLNLVIMGIVQTNLNEFWEDQQITLSSRKGFSPGEIVWIVIGIALWVVYIVSLIAISQYISQ